MFNRCALSGLLALLVLVAPAVLAETPQAEPGSRPKIGLVLSGGGAKGLAHVGVLRVLEEMRVPVDVIVGTSAGSAIGALYALGMPVAQIEQQLIDINWLASFRDDPGRAYKAVRRKSDDWRYPVEPGIGIRLDGIHLGSGIIAGQNLGFILNELTRDAALVEDFDRLPIAFRAVATDLETGEQVVLRRGDLATAIRASMSIPGVYAPVELDGRMLVDGGVANNIPVSVAHDMGADIIIAVDITDRLQDVESLREAFSVVGQLTTLMTRMNADQQLELLQDQDVLIRPDLEGHGSTDFYNAPVIFELGATAAREHATDLRPLQVSEDDWRVYQGHRSHRPASIGNIVGIRIADDIRLDRRFLRARLRQKLGQPLDVDQLEEDLKRIYGLGYYEMVSYSLSPTGQGSVLNVVVKEKSWGPNYLSFGLDYEDNFNDDTRFNVGAALRMTELNDWGGEWKTGARLGTEPRIRTEWFQPLDYGFKRFLIAGATYQRNEQSVFNSTGDRIAEVDITQRELDLSLGTELGVNAEARLGITRGYATVDDQVGARIAPGGAIDQGGWNLRLVHDSLDDPFLPKSGAFAGIRGEYERPGMGADRNLDRYTMMLAAGGSWNEYGVVGQLYASAVTDGVPGVENSVLLGGFRQLSAYSRGEIAGPDAALASVFVHQRFGGPFVPYFAGVGFETGNAWQSLGDARWNNLLRSWSVFAGVDTFLGPVQLATAYNNRDDWSAYLNIGFAFTQLFD